MRHRNVEQDCFRGIEQTVDVLLELEDAPVVSPNPLKNAVAIEQPVIEHGNFGVLLVTILAVNVDFHARKTAAAYGKRPAGRNRRIGGRSGVVPGLMSFNASALQRSLPSSDGFPFHLTVHQFDRSEE